MTTVVVLGGGGRVARTALRVLAGRGDLDLVAADVRPEAAEASAAAVGARSLDLDVSDARALRAVLETADLVVDLADPPGDTAGHVLAAAIDTGTDYIDACDDTALVAASFELHGRAVDAGVTAVVGMGASPGLSNLLAAIAARHLDELVDVFTAWPVDVDLEGVRLTAPEEEIDAGATAAVRWIRQISGTVTTVRDGSLATSVPLEPITLDHPGRGRGTAYVVGHPEPVMLRHSLRPTGASANLIVATEGTAAFLDRLRRDIDVGELSVEAAAAELDRPSPARVVRAGLSSLRTAGPGKLPGFFALARGVRGGSPTTAAARLLRAPRGIAGITGIPLALAVGRLVDGDVSATGVLAPESVLEPVAMFEALAPHCEVPGVRWTDVVRVDVA